MGCVYQFWVHRLPFERVAVAAAYPGPLRAAYRLRRVTLTADSRRRLPMAPPADMPEVEFGQWRRWCEVAGFEVVVTADPAQR